MSGTYVVMLHGLILRHQTSRAISLIPQKKRNILLFQKLHWSKGSSNCSIKCNIQQLQKSCTADASGNWPLCQYIHGVCIMIYVP